MDKMDMVLDLWQCDPRRKITYICTMEIKNLIQTPLSSSQYVNEDTKKNQIVLHHTVSGPDGKKVVNG